MLMIVLTLYWQDLINFLQNANKLHREEGQQRLQVSGRMRTLFCSLGEVTASR